MIINFKHNGLSAFFQSGNPFGLSTTDVPKLEMQLALLSHAENPREMNIPGWNLKPLTDKQQANGYWSVTVNPHYDLTFRFKDGNAHDVNLAPKIKVINPKYHGSPRP